MHSSRTQLIVLLVLQAVAIIIYPLAFFQAAPQAAVLPPALFILFVIAIVAMNSGWFSAEAGRTSLIFVQGINIVVRLMMLFPNLKNAAENWDWLLLIFQIVSMVLSWYTITQMEKQLPNDLLFATKTKV
jgi:ABC-type transport system involved in multi-copper enzyme maturation permease subunit